MKKIKEQITDWCVNNLLNEQIVINFIIEYGRNQIEVDIDNEMSWAEKLSSNFNKQLTYNNLEEKIIRSFIYGNPTQFTFSNVNSDSIADTYKTIINFKDPLVLFAEPNNFINYRSHLAQNETMTHISKDFVHYIFYNEDDSSDDLLINVFILNQILPSWLIPSSPLIVNPLLTLEMSKNKNIIENKYSINFSDSPNLQRFRNEIINNWNFNILIWNTNYTPILKVFYNNIYIHILKYY